MCDRHAVMPMFNLRVGVSFGGCVRQDLYDPGIVTDVPDSFVRPNFAYIGAYTDYGFHKGHFLCFAEPA